MLASIKENQPDLSMYDLVNVTGGLLAKQPSPGNLAANLGGDGVCTGKVVDLALRAKRYRASSEAGLVLTRGRWDAGFAMRGQGQYEDRFRTPVQIDEASAHDVMCAAVEAMKRAVSIDAPKVRVAMPSVRFHKGFAGDVAFEDKGDMKEEGAITVHDFKGGRTAVLEAMSV